MSVIQQQNSLPAAPRLGSMAWARVVWPWLLALVIALILPVVFSSGHAITLLNQMAVMILFALSYNMLLGNTGLLSFGHAVYFGLGAFVAMHALRAMNDEALALPIELLPLVGAFAGLGFGILFGAVTTRRAGVVFAMISLGVGELVFASSLMFTGFFGGEGGLFGDRQMVNSLFGIDYGSDLTVYYLVIGWVLLAAIAIFALRKTPLGWMANAVRDNPERAQFVGYNPYVVRFLQFSLSAFFAGLAGGLFVITQEIVTDETVGPILSGVVLLSTFVGGMGFFLGPVVGAGLVTWLETSLAAVTDAWMLYFGVLFIAVVMFAPYGLVGLAYMQYHAFRAGQWRGTVLARLYAVVTVLVALVGLVSIVEMTFQVRHSWDPSLPIKLFGVEVVATETMPWIVAGALLVVGIAAFLLHARPLLRRRLAAAGGKS